MTPRVREILSWDVDLRVERRQFPARESFFDQFDEACRSCAR
jgi:hypothetical protein